VLDPEYRKRLRAEEVARWELRQELERARTPGERVFNFLNKPIAIWALSSLILTGVTASYTRWLAHQAESRRTRDLIDKLDFEIDARFSQFLESMDDLVIHPYTRAFTFKAETAPDDIEARLQELKAPPSRNAHGWVVGVYPEFERTGLPALIMQLRSQISNEREKEELKESGKILSQSHSLVPPGPDFMPVWQTLKRGILLNRWSGFWYTDCGMAPFC